MILRNLQIVGDTGIKYIQIKEGKINAITDNINDFAASKEEQQIEFDNAIAFPGLINSHDHLDFNLFPQLGNRIYNSYTEWGKDIHEKNKEIINDVLKVPENLRVQWGIYKNLLNGVTTVVNHGKKLLINNDLITVLQYNSVHSPQFEKGWKWKLKKPFTKEPIVMHIGEGTDKNARAEIDEVISSNIWKKKIIAVHGVAMNEKQAGSFHGLVWCPASNYFLLDKTADVDKLKNKIKIVFGTDSTLTASWNMWEHFRMARRSGLNDEELLSMLTVEPAKLWNLNTGNLKPGKDADVLIVRKKNFYEVNPNDILVIIHKGEVRLFDSTMIDYMKEFLAKNFSKISLDDKIKFVKGDLSGLILKIKEYFPGMSFNL
jgi:cytosine/adenosine deaminase-related metal-dependent hydrolase